LAAEIQQAIGVPSELVSSSGGVFEIFVDGRKIFSKKSLGRFPEDGEIVGMLRARA
jgi:selenoprotein W-related protein